MTAGYWHTTYWCTDYWHEDYWQDYGTAVISGTDNLAWLFVM